MKTPPDTPEYNKFTDALRTVLSVSKEEMQRRLEAEKTAKPSSRVPAAS